MSSEWRIDTGEAEVCDVTGHDDDRAVADAEQATAQEEQMILDVEDSLRKLLGVVHSAKGERALRKKQRRGNFALDVTGEEAEVQQKNGHQSWRSRTLHFLHSDKVQMFLIVLLLLDVAIVACELFVEAQFPPCLIITRDAVSCVPVACAANISAHHHRRLEELHEEAEGQSSWLQHLLFRTDHRARLLASSEHDEHHLACDSSDYTPVASIETACDMHKYSGLHTAHLILMSLSVVILILFLAELVALMLCLGLRFWKNGLYVLDMIIVSVSLSLEFIFYVLSEVQMDGFVPLILFGRFWRFIRVAHGLATSVHENAECTIKDLEENIEQLGKHTAKLKADNADMVQQLHSMSKRQLPAGQRPSSSGTEN